MFLEDLNVNKSRPPQSERDMAKEKLDRVVTENIRMLKTEGYESTSDESMGGNARTFNVAGLNILMTCKGMNAYCDEDGILKQFTNYENQVRSGSRRHITFRVGIDVSEYFQRHKPTAGLIVEVYGTENATPEIKKIFRETQHRFNVESAKSFHDLKIAVALMGELESSTGETISTAELLQRLNEVQTSRSNAALLPREFGLRYKVIELLRNEIVH
ncbi:TPA: hypothetical protein DF272_01230 [Candidatus Falkowbacteria bacterium]|nr:hypothetical protein [Candidatus Falkowbacteria bacterium]